MSTPTLAVQPRRLWLVRHAQPVVAPGTCYGALDIPADPAATHVAAVHLAAALPAAARVHHSPLQRCEQLAHNLQALRPDLMPKPDARLREMDFGAWEGHAWDTIARAEIDAWTAAFASYRPGGGEALSAMLGRVAAALESHGNPSDADADAHNDSHEEADCDAPPIDGVTKDVVWITHAGVIRCVAWLQSHGSALPRSEEWPLEAPAFGEWAIAPLAWR